MILAVAHLQDGGRGVFGIDPRIDIRLNGNLINSVCLSPLGCQLRIAVKRKNRFGSFSVRAADQQKARAQAQKRAE